MAHSKLALTAVAMLACLASAYGDAFVTFCSPSRDITPGSQAGNPSPLCSSLAGVSWSSLSDVPSVANLTATPGTLNVQSWNWGLKPKTGSTPTFNTLSFRYEDHLPNQIINAALRSRAYESMLILELASDSTPLTAWYFINVTISALERNFSATSAVSWDVVLSFASARHYVFGPNSANPPVITPSVPRTCIPSNAPGCFAVPTARKVMM